jgi:hypothetical protein
MIGAMRAEISFDLMMTEAMEFVEGTYRLPGGDWQVFIFGPDSRVAEPVVTTGGRWKSGVTGVFVAWPEGMRLNKGVVLRMLSEALGVAEWVEVAGPDSMELR